MGPHPRETLAKLPFRGRSGALSPCGGGRGVRGPPRASAARWSRTPRSDRRREHAPRQRERLLRGAVSIGTRGYLAGPPHHPSRRSTRTVVSWTRGIPRRAAPAHPPAPDSSCMWGLFRSRREETSQGPHAPDRTTARLSPALAAPCSSSRREGTGLPSIAALGRGAPHPRPLPRGERAPEPARLVPEARCAPFRGRFAKVSSGRERAPDGAKRESGYASGVQTRS